jgi:type IV pilus assembly protein PilY1
MNNCWSLPRRILDLAATASMVVWTRTLVRLFRLLLLAGLSAGAAQAQTSAGPSPDPLLNRDGGGVKPNVMLMIDDSGSMLFQHMPDSQVFLGTSTTPSIGPIKTVTLAGGFAGSFSVVMHPSDTLSLSSFYAGVVAANTTSTAANWQQRFLRSADTNTIYYNPRTLYQPWMGPSGSRMPSATPTSAPIDPMAMGGRRVNLLTVTLVTTNWCGAPGSSTVPCSSTQTGPVLGAGYFGATRTLSFNPAIYYTLNSTGGSYSATNVTASYTLFNLNPTSGTPTFTKYISRTDCTGASCTLAQERQNFANWFTYYRNRALLAKAGLSEALTLGTDTFRLGYGTINKNVSTPTLVDGVSTQQIVAGVRDFTVSRRSETIAWLHTLTMSGPTPLRLAVKNVGEYYRRTDSLGPWSDTPGTSTTASHKSCRRSYNFLVTDGYWNEIDSALGTLVGNVDNTLGPSITGPSRSYQYEPAYPYRDSNENFLADYAMWYWNTDLRSGTGTVALTNNVTPSTENPAFWQHMSNFIVGLGVRGLLNPASDLPNLGSGASAGSKSWGTDRIDDLWHAAINSRGAYYSAKDATELASAFTSAISTAIERELRESGVATASTILEDGNRKYVPLFRTSAWNGDIQALSLDSSGVAGPVQWTAEARMPTWSSRNIVTWDASTSRGISFTWATLSASSRSALGSVTATFTNTFVNFLRGDRSNEGSASLFRARDGVLGDFINSNPVFVRNGLDSGYTLLPAGGSTYAAFLTAKAARTGVLFVGANDGMLHGFKDTKTGAATDGAEVFAYVPRAVYPSLSQLASKTYGTTSNYHRYFVDGSLKEIDAFIPSGGTGTPTWKNLLIGSTGVGARAIFALDVTDTSNLGTPTIRWEISDANDSDIGYVTAPLEAGVLPNGEWVVIFGNGSFSGAGAAKLMVVNLATGVIQKVSVGSGPSNGLGGVTAIRDANGQIVKLYAGDLSGKVWRFDYDSTQAARFSLAFGGSPLFQDSVPASATPQMISQPPVIYTHPNGGDLVVFATGALLTTSDASSTLTHTIYGVWDKGTTETFARPLTRSNLVGRSVGDFTGTGGATFYSVSGATVTWTGSDRGWTVDLGFNPGLRTIYPPQRINSNLVLVSTVAPAVNVVACESALGRGANFIFDVFTGLAATYPVFDTNGDAVFDSADTVAAGTSTGADGVDAIVRGQTTCSGAYCYTRFSVQNTTGQLMIQGRESASVPVIQDRTWRRILNPPIR